MTDTEFRDAFRSHKDVVYRFAYRMTGSTANAEDVVQDCFVALWRKPAGFDPARGSLRSFLLGMARNVILKRWRDERVSEVLEEDALVVEPLNPEMQERAEAVAVAIKMLPPLQREALILAEYEELSLEEIASAVQAETGTVKSRLHRARENLRRLLAPLLEDTAEKGSRYGIKK